MTDDRCSAQCRADFEALFGALLIARKGLISAGVLRGRVFSSELDHVCDVIEKFQKRGLK